MAETGTGRTRWYARAVSPSARGIGVRRAVETDLPAVVRLFALEDDGNKEDADPATPLDPRYARALATIDRDPNLALMVAVDDARVVGVLQLALIQHVAYRGGRVAQIENVIVDPSERGRGVGEAMMRWAIDEAKRSGCFRVQLTSNKRRERAHRFCERLGFVASHEGMKLLLPRGSYNES